MNFSTNDLAKPKYTWYQNQSYQTVFLCSNRELKIATPNRLAPGAPTTM
jgi:hypothetical protein